jgi:hypothetical protein
VQGLARCNIVYSATRHAAPYGRDTGLHNCLMFGKLQTYIIFLDKRILQTLQALGAARNQDQLRAGLCKAVSARLPNSTACTCVTQRGDSTRTPANKLMYLITSTIQVRFPHDVLAPLQGVPTSRTGTKHATSSVAAKSPQLHASRSVAPVSRAVHQGCTCDQNCEVGDAL